MVKFKFFVHCKGWKDGGYENAHFAETAKEARRIIKKWNDEDKESGSGAKVSLISITEISDREFAEDFIY